MSRVLAILGGLVCIAGGAYLLLSETADPDSYLQTIAHGMGIYFVGKGLFVLAWAASTRPSRNTVCPRCREPIDKAATICPHCRTELGGS